MIGACTTGEFGNIGGEPLAALSSFSGNAFAGFALNPTDAVNAVEVEGDNLYMGGSFFETGGRNQIAYAQFSP